MNIDTHLDQLVSKEAISQLDDRFDRVAEIFAIDLSRAEAEIRIYGFLIEYIKVTTDAMRTLRELASQYSIEAQPDRHLIETLRNAMTQQR